MASKLGSLPLSALLLAACAAPPAATPQPEASPVPSALASSASPGVAPVGTPSSSPVEQGGALISSEGHPTPDVGTTVTLKLMAYFDHRPMPGASWALDPAHRERAVLTPSADGADCQVLVLKPGAIHVTASLGGSTQDITLAAIASPNPTTQIGLDGQPSAGVSYHGPFYPLPDATVLVKQADDWTRLWQAVAAKAVQANGVDSRLPLPPMPPIDLTTSSLVVSMASYGEPTNPIVLTDLDGVGHVSLVRPLEAAGAPPPTVEVSYLSLYKTPLLPATASIGCEPACPEPLPSSHPLADLAPASLVVGQTLDLPDHADGTPLAWTLEPRTAAHARLDGLHLTAVAPGALVLTVNDGVSTATVTNAIRQSADLDVAPAATLPTTLDAPRLITTQAAWLALWPSAPPVDFSQRAILAATLPTQTRPVLTAIEGNTAHLVISQVTGAGHMAAGKTPTTYFYEIPTRADTPAVKLDD